MRKVILTQEQLRQQGVQEPTVAQIAQCTGIPQDKVEELLRLSPKICSLESTVAPDSEETLQVRLEDTDSIQPLDALVRQELKKVMETLLQKLTPRQQQVLRLRYAMEDGVCHSLEQIGEILQISKERARQIEHEAMDKLKIIGADLGLEDYLS